MRILIDLTALADNFTGIERYAASLAYEMVMSFNEEYILVFKGTVHEMFQSVAAEKNVETVVLPRCNKLIFNQFRLPAALHRLKADWYLFLAFPVPVLTFKKKMISTIHDICCWDCPETMNGLSKWYFRISHRIAMKKCSSIITISEFSKRRIMKRLKYPEEKLLLTYCGIEDKFKNIPEGAKKKAHIAEQYHLPEHYILSLSTLEPRKNLRILIEAYIELKEQNKMDVPLVLAGRKGWKMDSLLEGINEQEKDQILFTGFIEDADLPYVYQGADFFVFPSKYEGFGIPPLEAMACGTPVLSSDATSLPEVLGDAAMYFESENVEDLKRKLMDMSALPDEKRQAGIKKGMERAEKFSWKIEAEKILSNLREKEDI